MSRDKNSSWAPLEELAREWYSLPAEGNEARRQSLEEQIFSGIVELVPKQLVDALGLFWTDDWKKFDPEKGSLQKFVSNRLNLRYKDMSREDFGKRHEGQGGKGKSEEAKGPEAEHEDPEHVDPDKMGAAGPAAMEKAPTWTRKDVSLNSSVGEDGDLGDLIAAPERELEQLANGMLLLALAIKLRERLTATRGERSRYFPLFFTGGVTHLVQETGLRKLAPGEESEIFEAMRLPFLDFFTQKECRNLAALSTVWMKPYGALVEGRPMDETKLPLPDDVYMAYLEKIEEYPVSRAAISLQKKAYRELGKKLTI